MGRRVEVPVTPSVLEWAIREGGFSNAEFAQRINVDQATLDGWLAGRGRPGKTEFAQMVRTLRRPSALFFRSTPPESTVPPELRSEPSGGRSLGPEELRKIRRALRLQRVVSEWLEEKGVGRVRFPLLQERTNPATAGEVLRKVLGVALEEQISWESPAKAFAGWRAAIAERQIQVLLVQLGQQGIRGFSSWNDFLPVIGVNTAYNQPARVYTVFHELAHLLARTQAACTDISPSSKPSSRVERWCERVASEALLPSDSVRGLFAELPVSDPFELVQGVADAFSVSLRAAAIRIGDLGLVDDPNGLYQLVDRNAVIWDRDKGWARSTTGRDRVTTRLSEVGPPIVSLFDEAITGGYLHERDIRDYMGLDPQEFDEAKARLELAG